MWYLCSISSVLIQQDTIVISELVMYLFVVVDASSPRHWYLLDNDPTHHYPLMKILYEASASAVVASPLCPPGGS